MDRETLDGLQAAHKAWARERGGRRGGRRKRRRAQRAERRRKATGGGPRDRWRRGNE